MRIFDLNDSSPSRPQHVPDPQQNSALGGYSTGAKVVAVSAALGLGYVLCKRPNAILPLSVVASLALVTQSAVLNLAGRAMELYGASVLGNQLMGRIGQFFGGSSSSSPAPQPIVAQLPPQPQPASLQASPSGSQEMVAQYLQQLDDQAGDASPHANSQQSSSPPSPLSPTDPFGSQENAGKLAQISTERPNAFDQIYKDPQPILTPSPQLGIERLDQNPSDPQTENMVRDFLMQQPKEPLSLHVEENPGEAVRDTLKSILDQLEYEELYEEPAPQINPLPQDVLTYEELYSTLTEHTRGNNSTLRPAPAAEAPSRPALLPPPLIHSRL